ncbi:hypothetical protein AB0O52_10675 [Arthrobacter sp. NPDC080073]|uniref:hypothetical protein n=1 Tax=Arthrobacter sp. NPDC080073 TaxID=3155919 RepID=UPI00341A683B
MAGGGTETDADAGVEAESWLMATGFSQQQHGGEFPDIRELDRITGERPHCGWQVPNRRRTQIPTAA